jgi:hypothetical protein
MGVLMLLPLAARAQQSTDCGAVVRQVLQATAQRCAAMGRDELCYGNLAVTLEPRAGVDAAAVRFETPGNTVSVQNVAAMRMAPLNLSTNEWGVVYMRLRAELADVAAGQFVTVLMFGDTEFRGAATAASGPNAFYFRTGIGGGSGAESGDGLGCRNLPTSGVLIQTPRGSGAVQLTVNEVRLTFGSTVLLEARDLSGASATPAPRAGARGAAASPTLRVRTFEGQATVEALGQTRVAQAGQQVRVPLNDDLTPSDPPEDAEYIDSDEYLGLFDFIDIVDDYDLFESREPEPTATLDWDDEDCEDEDCDWDEDEDEDDGWDDGGDDGSDPGDDGGQDDEG